MLVAFFYCLKLVDFNLNVVKISTYWNKFNNKVVRSGG